MTSRSLFVSKLYASRLRQAIAVSTAVASGLLVHNTYAQEDGALEEIVVTARYREESLQVSPLAISAISAQELDERSFTSSADIALNIPNASFRPAQAAFGNTMTAFIRGIGQNDFDFAFEPGVGVYIDDVYFPTTMGSMMDLMDLERVEVLRGPQGTLFGRGSLGGAIRMVSKKPAGDNTGEIQLSTGQFNRRDIRASYDFAITDTLFARVSGMSKQRDGYQDRIDFACAYPGMAGTLTALSGNQRSGCKLGTQGGDDVSGYRASLLWSASDQLEVSVNFDKQIDKSEVRANALLAVDVKPPYTVWNSFMQDTFGVTYDERFIAKTPFETYGTFTDPLTGLQVDPLTSIESEGMSAKIDYQFTDKHGMTVILSKREFNSRFGNDHDASPLNIQMVDGVQIMDSQTAEVRFSGLVLDDKMEYTVGGFIYKGDVDSAQRVIFPGLLYSVGAPYPTLSKGVLVDGLIQNEAKNKSLFGHLVYDMTDKLAFTLGGRWSEDSKYSDFNNSIVSAVVDTTSDRYDWKVGVDYQLNDEIMVYASAASGYRPEAYNPRPFQVTQFVSVDGEEAVSYDMGIKGDFLNNTLRLNAAVFYVDYKQRITGAGGVECLADADGNYTGLVPAGTPGAVTDTRGNICVGGTTSMTNYINTPGEITGAEIELTWRPIDALTLSGVYGYTGWDSADLSGNNVVVDRPAYVPEFNWSFSAQYDIYMQDGSQLSPRIDVYGQDEICTSVTSLNSCSPGYELMNARVQWTSADEGWSAALGMNNVTDKEYFYNRFDGTAFGQPYTQGQPGRPQEWYFQVNRQF